MSAPCQACAVLLCPARLSRGPPRVAQEWSRAVGPIHRSPSPASECRMTIVTSAKGLKYKHFILTRFWFRRGPTSANTLNQTVDQWLENRLGIFLSYCLPSVVAQSCQDFQWLIYFDACVPADFLQKMRDLVVPYPNIEITTLKAWGVPTFVSDIPEKDRTVGTSELLEDLKRRIGGEVEWVLTSRLDSDDGLHHDFVKRLHAEIGGPREEMLNFPNGILCYDNRTYLYAHRSNAFISFFEPVSTIKTVVCGGHESLHEVASIRQLSPMPAFLQVVHGTNHSNKPRGQRVPKILGLQGFEAITSLYEAPLEENASQILLDNVVWGSLWHGRDQLLNQYRATRKHIRKVSNIGAR
jgi:hypothetical protein